MSDGDYQIVDHDYGPSHTIRRSEPERRERALVLTSLGMICNGLSVALDHIGKKGDSEELVTVAEEILGHMRREFPDE